MMVCSPVCAETITGTLGGPDVIISSTYNFPPNAVIVAPPVSVTVANIELTTGATSLVRFDNGLRPTYFSTTPIGDTTTFTASIGSNLIATGTIGYQRNFNAAPPYNEIDGYQYLTFNSWNPGSYTGQQIVNLTLAGSLNGMNFTNYWGSTGGGATGILLVGLATTPIGGDSARSATGNYLLNRAGSIQNTYTVTKPSGIGIAGDVNKQGYIEKVFIFNGTSGAQLSADPNFNSNNFTINVPAGTIIISVLDTFSNWYNTSVLFSIPVPTPTPTSIPSEGYTLYVSPSSVSFGSNFTATITSSTGGFPGISEIRYSSSAPAGLLTDSGNHNYLLSFVNTTGTWFELDNAGGTGFSINKGTSIPTPEISTTDFGTGTFTISAYLVKTTGQVITLTAPLTVTSGGMQDLTISAKDFGTGFLVNGAHINVLNYGTGLWDNKTPITGQDLWYYPFNTNLFVEASKTGWATASKNWTVSGVPTYDLWMILYSGTTPPAGNVTLQVEVFDAYNLAPIPGALVHAYPSGSNGESKFTSNAGVTTFNTSENTIYTIAVTKYGYQDGGSIINTGPGGATIDELIMLHRATAPTPTVTVPTTIPTNIPTTSPVGPSGNYTGFWGPIYNLWGAMGADAFWIQILMACMCVFCGVALGGFGAGTIFPGQNNFDNGMAQLGGILGIVVGCAAGFINIAWIVVIFAFLAFKIFLMPR